MSNYIILCFIDFELNIASDLNDTTDRVINDIIEEIIDNIIGE